MSSDNDVPAFVRGGSMWDMRTYSGRYRHFVDFIDPRYLLPSVTSQLPAARQLLDDYDHGRLPPPGADEPAEERRRRDAQLWLAQRRVQCSYAADDSIIPMPFRMCGFVPFNSVVLVGMLLPLGPYYQALFQWINQTHNALINHYNRPSREPAPISDMALPYGLAVGSALSCVFGASALIRRANVSAAAKQVMSRLVPFLATATANVANLTFMRSGELVDGIPVLDADGRQLAVSTAAAKQAIQATAVTRVMLTTPLLALPPFILPAVDRSALIQRVPALRIPVHAAILTGLFYAALPNMLAFYPRIMAIQTAQLEPEIQARLQDHQTLYFDRGL